ncbi:hypothetical protein Plhal703r1_c13g0064441 [Plasmopara halstedii]
MLSNPTNHRVFSYFRSGAVDGATLAPVKIFTALDDLLGLDIFRFGCKREYLTLLCRHLNEKYANNTSYSTPILHCESDAIDMFLDQSSTMYVQFSNSRRLAYIILEVSCHRRCSRFLLRQIFPENFMHIAAAYVRLCNLKVVHAHLDVAKWSRWNDTNFVKYFELFDDCPVCMTLKNRILVCRVQNWFLHPKKKIRCNVQNEDALMVNELLFTLRTDKFVRDRYALRMDPQIMGYGTSNRMIYPSSTDGHAFESTRHYNEACNLLFAQYLRNKDLPEEGVVSSPWKFTLGKSAMAFSDALLDLTSTDEDVKSKVLDCYGKDELIGVGSDDNIIPEDIVWMKKRVAFCSYLMSRALIQA